MIFEFLSPETLLAQYYLFALVVFIPVFRIFERAGFSSYWALLLGIPNIGLVFCTAFLALRKWPEGKR